MAERMEEMIKKYRDRGHELTAAHRIRDICHTYKVPFLLSLHLAFRRVSSQPLHLQHLSEHLLCDPPFIYFNQCPQT